MPREVHPLRTTSTPPEAPRVPGVYTPGIHIRNVWTSRIKTSAWGQVACLIRMSLCCSSSTACGNHLCQLRNSHLCRILNMPVIYLYSLSCQEFPKICFTSLINFSPSVCPFFFSFLPFFLQKHVNIWPRHTLR